MKDEANKEEHQGPAYWTKDNRLIIEREWKNESMGGINCFIHCIHDRRSIHARSGVSIHVGRDNGHSSYLTRGPLLDGLGPSLQALYPKGKAHGSIEPNLSATVSCICRS